VRCCSWWSSQRCKQQWYDAAAMEGGTSLGVWAVSADPPGAKPCCDLRRRVIAVAAQGGIDTYGTQPRRCSASGSLDLLLHPHATPRDLCNLLQGLLLPVRPSCRPPEGKNARARDLETPH
jgi:hypothetical protein